MADVSAVDGAASLERARVGSVYETAVVTLWLVFCNADDRSAPVFCKLLAIDKKFFYVGRCVAVTMRYVAADAQKNNPWPPSVQ